MPQKQLSWDQSTASSLHGTRFLGELPEQAGSGRNRHVLQFLGVISAGVLTGNDERKVRVASPSATCDPVT